MAKSLETGDIYAPANLACGEWYEVIVRMLNKADFYTDRLGKRVVVEYSRPDNCQTVYIDSKSDQGLILRNWKFALSSKDTGVVGP